MLNDTPYFLLGVVVARVGCKYRRNSFFFVASHSVAAVTFAFLSHHRWALQRWRDHATSEDKTKIPALKEVFVLISPSLLSARTHTHTPVGFQDREDFGKIIELSRITIFRLKTFTTSKLF